VAPSGVGSAAAQQRPKIRRRSTSRHRAIGPTTALLTQYRSMWVHPVLPDTFPWLPSVTSLTATRSQDIDDGGRTLQADRAKAKSAVVLSAYCAGDSSPSGRWDRRLLSWLHGHGS
jgi:hypothetical protein